MLGEGNYGQVWTARDEMTGNTVALKIDSRVGQKETANEATIYKQLAGIEGIPKMIATGKHNKKTYIAMELLGGSLHDKCNEVEMSSKDVLMLAIQSIKILQQMHQKGLVHQDLKPENIMTGKEDNNTIYLMDFGLTKSFLNKNKVHKRITSNITPVGTAAFASLNCHMRKSQSRRDDLEAMGYVFLFCLNNMSLPWDLENPNEETFDNIYPKKSQLSSQEMFAGHPQCFCEYMSYTRKLGFTDEPNYTYLIELFETEMQRLGLVADSFDFNKTQENDDSESEVNSEP